MKEIKNCIDAIEWVRFIANMGIDNTGYLVVEKTESDVEAEFNKLCEMCMQFKDDALWKSFRKMCKMYDEARAWVLVWDSEIEAKFGEKHEHFKMNYEDEEQPQIFAMK